MSDLKTFLSLIQSFAVQFNIVHVAAWHEPEEKWHLSFYLFVPFATEKSQGEMPATPTPKLKSVLEDIIGCPVESSERHTLECEVPEVTPDLLRRIEKAVQGNQRDYWEADPAVVRGIEEDENDPELQRIRTAFRSRQRER